MTLPSYRSIRDTRLPWLGRVPSHWRTKRLRFVAALNPSKAEISGLHRATEVSFLPMESVGDDGSIRLDRTRSIAEVETGYTYFRDGDVAFAKITPCFENGKGALMQGLVAGVGFGTTELVVARPKPSEVTGPYLNWLFRSPNFRLQGEASMYGAGGQKRVPDDFVRNFAWAFPPLDEQAVIASFLDRETAKIDALIAEQEKLIALLAEKRQATISHAVTKGLNPDAPMKDSGVPWLGEMPAHWAIPPLYLRYSVELGKMLDASRITGEHSLPYLRNADVQWDAINMTDLPVMDILPAEYARYTVRCGDLLVCEGGDVGRAAVVPEVQSPVGFQKALHRLRSVSGAEHPRYMFYTFSWASRAGAFAGEGQSTIAHLTGEQLRKYRFPAPPMDEQVEIARFLDSEITILGRLAETARQVISLLKERRSALIAAAVTGQIDVRNAVSH